MNKVKQIVIFSLPNMLNETSFLLTRYTTCVSNKNFYFNMHSHSCHKLHADNKKFVTVHRSNLLQTDFIISLHGQFA